MYDLADRAAVRSLLSNHEAVVKFCSRAVSLAKGKSGMTVSAPLAGPLCPIYMCMCVFVYMVCYPRAIIYR